MAKLRRQPLFWIFLISGLLTVMLITLNQRGAVPSKKMDGFPLSMERSGNIGVINIDGVILESLPILDDLRDMAEDERIRALLIRVNSPGGAVGPSQEIYDQLRKIRSVKPVVISLGAVAASGGYYIACGGHQIVAEPGTLTGSIGVIMQMSYLEDLYKFLKIQPFVIKAGKYKDVGNTSRKMTAEERELLQRLIDETHLQFQKAVADGRGLSLDYVKTFADGRILNGESAKAYGLVDVLGNFDDAIEVAARLAKIQKPKLVYPKSHRLKSVRDFLGSLTDIGIRALHRWQFLPPSPERYGALFLWDGTR